MTEPENLTRREAEQEMQQLRKVFSLVRLLDERQLQGRAEEGEIPCFAHWQRQRPCENCIAKKALEEKTRKSRLEYIGQELYQVTAYSVMVEGSACVIEMAQKMDNGMLLDPDDGDRLLDSITVRREKLYRDALTGAYNRHYYEEIYKERVLTAGVALIGLDDLKLFNDIYGHYAGDSILETAVGVIRRSMGGRDRLIRMREDELLLLLPEIQQEQLGQKLEQIRLQLCATGVPGYSRIRMSASIGGVWAKDSTTETALRRARQLMNYARMQKNTVITDRQPEPQSSTEHVRRQSVLIVDDSSLNRGLLSRMLCDRYDTAEAASGEECLRLLEQNPKGISIVLLDIHMDGMDGFAVLEALNKRHLLEELPVIMISSEDGVESVRRAFDLGASDYISRPFDAKVVYQRVSNTIRLYTKQRRLSAMAADQAYEKEKNSRMMIDILSQLVEKRNGESRDHVQRISALTDLLLLHLVNKTDRYLLPQETRRMISAAAVLHDIGKMELSEELLHKQDELTEAERQIMQSHTLRGAEMMQQMKTYAEETFLQTAYQICRWHHERYDGSGYPDRLTGEQIPISAQIVGLADTYDSMTHPSPTGRKQTHHQAVRLICSGRCGAFNPLLLECLQELEPELEDAMQSKKER